MACPGPGNKPWSERGNFLCKLARGPFIQQDSLGLGLPWGWCGQRRQKWSTECQQNASGLG